MEDYVILNLMIERNGVPKLHHAIQIRNVANQKYSIDGNITVIDHKEQEMSVVDFTNIEITQN